MRLPFTSKRRRLLSEINRAIVERDDARVQHETCRVSAEEVIGGLTRNNSILLEDLDRERERADLNHKEALRAVGALESVRKELTSLREQLDVYIIDSNVLEEKKFELLTRLLQEAIDLGEEKAATESTARSLAWMYVDKSKLRLTE